MISLLSSAARCLRSAPLLLLFSPFLSAADLRVPAEYPTIQEAIDAAVEGDRVLVAEGLYSERIDFLGKSITVTAEGSNCNTFLDGAGLVGGLPMVRFASREDREAKLVGFTIRNAFQAISIGSASPTIQNCEIRNCGGNAVLILRLTEVALLPDPLFLDCEFANNVADAGVGVGALTVIIAKGRFEGCRFTSNEAPSGAGAHLTGTQGTVFSNCLFLGNQSNFGAAVYCSTGEVTFLNTRFQANGFAGLETGEPNSGGAAAVVSAHALFAGCLWTQNTASNGSALSILGFGSASVINSTLTQNEPSDHVIGGFSQQLVVQNSILWNNQARSIEGANAWVEDSIVEGGYPGIGVLNQDPAFEDALGSNFRLSSSSPAFDRGDNANVPVLLTTDLAGQPRILSLSVDLGAFEGWVCGNSLVGFGVDCNGNGVPDQCDIEQGTSLDCNQNGVADECEETATVQALVILDGSGSVPNFDILPEGVAAWLCDGSTPTDGRVGFNLIQFSGGSCESFPRERITSPEQLNSICNVVSSTQQQSGQTLLAPALERAYGLLLGETALLQRVVVFTDGGATDQQEALQVANQIRAELGVPISVGDLGASGPNLTFLEELANIDPASELPQGKLQQADTALQVTGLLSDCIPLPMDSDGDGVPDDCESPCLGDLDGNGVVEFADQVLLLSEWGPCPDCAGDLNSDGIVDFTDLQTLLANWGPCTG